MRIYVADDEPNIADLLAMVLTSLGHTVGTANDGAAALAGLEGGEYALLVADLSMPKMDGLALAQEAKARNLVRKVAILTGSGGQQVMPPGVDYVLAKPVDVDKLKAIIAELGE